MSFEYALSRGRAMFELRFRGRCKVERATGEKHVDEYGREFPAIDTIYTNLPCYVSYDGVPFESTFDSAGVTVTQGRVELVTAVGKSIIVDDVVTITNDPDSPELVGSSFRVASQVPRSQGTRQRVLLEDNQKGVWTSD